MSYGIDFVFVFFRIDSFRDYYVGSESWGVNQLRKQQSHKIS